MFSFKNWYPLYFSWLKLCNLQIPLYTTSNFNYFNLPKGSYSLFINKLYLYLIYLNSSQWSKREWLKNCTKWNGRTGTGGIGWYVRAKADTTRVTANQFWKIWKEKEQSAELIDISLRRSYMNLCEALLICVNDIVMLCFRYVAQYCQYVAMCYPLLIASCWQCFAQCWQ